MNFRKDPIFEYHRNNFKYFFLISNSTLLESTKRRSPSIWGVYKRDTHLGGGNNFKHFFIYK
jgi:hypothetical protein